MERGRIRWRNRGRLYDEIFLELGIWGDGKLMWKLIEVEIIRVFRLILVINFSNRGFGILFIYFL